MRGFAVVGKGLGAGERARNDTVVGVIDIEDEVGESEEAAGFVGNKGAALAATPMGPDGEKRHFEVGDVEDVRQFDGLVAERQNDGATASAGDLLAVGDGDVAVLERRVGEERLAHRAHVLGTPAVNARVGAVGASSTLNPSEIAVGDGSGHVGVTNAVGLVWEHSGTERAVDDRAQEADQRRSGAQSRPEPRISNNQQ